MLGLVLLVKGTPCIKTTWLKLTTKISHNSSALGNTTTNTSSKTRKQALTLVINELSFSQVFFSTESKERIRYPRLKTILPTNTAFHLNYTTHSSLYSTFYFNLTCPRTLQSKLIIPIETNMMFGLSNKLVHHLLTLIFLFGL